MCAYTLDFDSMETFVAEDMLPGVHDQIFQKKDLLTRMLKDKAKIQGFREIQVNLLYDDSIIIEDVAEYDELTLSPIDPYTKSIHDPKLTTATLLISLEEELQMTSDKKVEDIIKGKMEVTKLGFEKHFKERIWARTQATASWNMLESVVGTGSFGGIPATGSVPEWWKSQILDYSDATFYDDLLNNAATAEANLTNPDSSSHIMKILAEGVNNAGYQTDEDPDIIIVSAWLWDLIEAYYNSQKAGSKMNEYAASLGFKAIDYRGIPIAKDKAMVNAQTTDID
ncbi:MAG: phage major capsid protein, partial [Candidatus Peribacteraceae bacterium]|nr:phage major capsid protein [Candidatus Peribacteraceae bacterium]